jgi:glycosyltransferase involved in cell wall biosynthesis
MDAEKFCYIPNGVSLDEWTPTDEPLPPQHQAALTRLRQAGRFVVGYAGGHALSNALDCLIEAARRLEGSPVDFVLVGKGVEKEALRRKTQVLGLTNVTFLPPLSKCLVPRLLREFDACYLGWARSPLYRFGVCPNKLLDYMMAGKPVIHGIEAGNDLVAEAECGISIPPENSEALAVAARKLCEMTPQDLSAMGQRGQRYVMRHHPYPHLARQFLEAVAR